MSEQYEIVEFKLQDNTTILVETVPDSSCARSELLGESHKIPQKALRSFKEAIDSIKSVAETTVHSIKEITVPPKEVTLELGIKLSGEAGAIITKVSTEGNIKVTFKWIAGNIEKIT